MFDWYSKHVDVDQQSKETLIEEEEKGIWIYEKFKMTRISRKEAKAIVPTIQRVSIERTQSIERRDKLTTLK